MQAGAMGLPSIVTDINGCNEIIIDGENGRIIPPRDEAGLESMMAWFIENRVEVASMAGRAAQMIKARYEQKDVWRAIMKMYLSLDR
jgi:glycosyltransferase involved in cell wall biosynthesis